MSPRCGDAQELKTIWPPDMLMPWVPTTSTLVVSVGPRMPVLLSTM